MKTALQPEHKKLGAKFIDFFGWEMPLQYTGILKEHLNVRKNLGLFDISHMGKLFIKGPQAEALLDFNTTNSINKLHVGQSQYSLILNEQGGIIDDIVVQKITDKNFVLISNAANHQQVIQHIKLSLQHFDASICDISTEFCLIALQGKKSVLLLEDLLKMDLQDIKYYWQKQAETEFGSILISRLGYTGEDGFEILIAHQKAKELWSTILDKGSHLGIMPVGLGARDTLRLEAGFYLHGQDITAKTNPFEVGLNWVVKMKKGKFIGYDSLLTQKTPSRKLYAFYYQDAGIPRSNYEVVDEKNNVIGHVTSGSISPCLNKGIGLALLNNTHLKPNDTIYVGHKGKYKKAIISVKPFIDIQKPLLSS